MKVFIWKKSVTNNTTVAAVVHAENADKALMLLKMNDKNAYDVLKNEQMMVFTEDQTVVVVHVENSGS